MPKYKLSIGAIIISILVPLAVSNSAYNDVSLAIDTIINVNSQDLLVTGSAAVIESILVDTSNFQVTLPAGATLKVKSASGKAIPISGIDGNAYSTECASGVNTLTIVMLPNHATEVATISASADACTASTATVVSSAGGGGGGGGSTAYRPTTSVSPSANATVPAAAPSQVVSFTEDLSRGMDNSDVTRLQQLLARDTAIYPEGSVTGYFGPATERAVKRFQAKYGISQIGRVGPATRAKLSSVYSTNTVSSPVSVPRTQVITAAVKIDAVFTKNMSKGTDDNDVRRLQQLLNTDTDTRIAPNGPGSPGNETTMFGSLTETAVQKFQVKHSVASPGQSGYGTVGPMTRAKLQEVFGK